MFAYFHFILHYHFIPHLLPLQLNLWGRNKTGPFRISQKKKTMLMISSVIINYPIFKAFKKAYTSGMQRVIKLLSIGVYTPFFPSFNKLVSN